MYLFSRPTPRDQMPNYIIFLYRLGLHASAITIRRIRLFRYHRPRLISICGLKATIRIYESTKSIGRCNKNKRYLYSTSVRVILSIDKPIIRIILL